MKLETGTHTARIYQLLVTPDGKTLLSAGDTTIRVWDVETKQQIRMLLGQIGDGSSGEIQRIALSRNGKYVVALAWMNPAGTDGALDRKTDVRVYELATGNLQAAFQFPGTLQDLDFSPDDKYLAIVGNPQQPSPRRGYIQLYAASNILQGFGAMPAPVASEALYEYEALIPAYVRFIPDKQEQSAGYRMVVATWYHHPGEAPEYTGGLLWYSASPDGALTKMSALRETEERVPPSALAVSRDFVIVTPALTTATKENKFFCHAHDGKLVATVPTESNPAQPAFSQDGNQLIVGQADDRAPVQVRMYDTMGGQFQLKSTYAGHDSAVHATALLSDGTAVSAGGDENAIHFWSGAHVAGEPTAQIIGVGQTVHAVGINSKEQIGFGNRGDLRLADGSTLLQRMFDLKAMTLDALSDTDAAAFRRVQKRFGDQSLEWKEQWGYTNLYLLPDDMPLTGVPPVGWYGVTTFGFTENGTIVTGAGDGKVRVAPRHADGSYDPPQRLLVGHAARILDHAAGGRWLVTAGADQIIRFWYLADVEQDSPADLQPALNLFVGSDDEWVIWSKSNYYNASQRGDRYIGFHVNRGPDKEALFFPSHRFIKAFFRPDIIQAIVEHGSEDRAFAKCEDQGMTIAPDRVEEILPPIVELSENGVVETNDDVTFTFTIEACYADKPATRAWVVHNEQVAWESLAPQAKHTVNVRLQPGRNRIKILAENATAKSNPLIQIFVRAAATPVAGGGAAERGHGGPTDIARGGRDTLLGNQAGVVGSNNTLYILAVGVSKIKNEGHGYKSLQFAHRDATAIYNAFAKATDADRLDDAAPLANRAFQAIDATVLLNEQATKERINAALEAICQKIVAHHPEGRANRDVLLVYLSGHGVYRKADQGLYYWNYDLDFSNTGGTGLGFMRLGEKITGLPAELILMTDTCHSGIAGGDIVKGIDPNELAKRIYGINERGMYIFSAARSFQDAGEASAILHGYFTKSLLEALFNHDRATMLELINAVQLRVQSDTLKNGIPQQSPVIRTYGDLLPLVVFQQSGETASNLAIQTAAARPKPIRRTNTLTTRSKTMPTATYTSFQIKNTSAVPMFIALSDPDGNAHTVGPIDPGAMSIQLAPIGAMWSISFELGKKGGESADRGGESADRGGESADRGGESADRGGESADRGGESADRGGESADRGGESADRGGESADRGGESADRGGESADRGGEDAA